jgi:hypothetical protein
MLIMTSFHPNIATTLSEKIKSLFLKDLLTKSTVDPIFYTFEATKWKLCKLQEMVTAHKEHLETQTCKQFM